MSRLRSAVVAASFLMACQNYNLRHITPLPVRIVNNDQTIAAQPGPAYIMIVEDLSGSMCEPIQADAGITDAGSGAGDCALKVSDSKIGLVAASMDTVLSGLDPASQTFYLGLTAFPDSAVGGDGGNCGAAPPVFPIDNAISTIPKITSWYQGSPNLINGGTPTAAALLAAAQDPGLSAGTSPKSKYIILLTDGLPNCNPEQACISEPWGDGVNHGCVSDPYIISPGANATRPADCQCSFGDCAVQSGNQCCVLDVAYLQGSPSQSELVPTAVEECLDGTNTVNTIAQLKAQGITTFVVGMGYDFNNPTLLDQMARAGAGQSSTGDAGHFQANSPQDLLDVIQTVVATAVQGCNYTLDATVADPALLEVVLDGTQLTLNDPNGFTYSAGGQGGTAEVDLVGNACATVKNGSTHTLDITAIAAP